VGLLDYYRQFQGVSEEEINEELRRKAAERRARALERVDPVDLSRTTWPEFTHPEAVSAITYHVRRGLHRYRDGRAEELRAELASRHEVEPSQLAIGGGAAQLFEAAARTLLREDDELLTPWPSYPLYPVVASRARAQAVPVPGFDPDGLVEAVTPSTRLLVICNPNDPTGEHLDAEALAGMLERLPERVVVILDEALVDYADAQPLDASLELLERFERLVVLRSFSKAWGLAGMRCGYAVGAQGAEPLLERVEPALGIGAATEAGALQSLRCAGQMVAERVGTVISERERLTAAIRELGVDVTPSQANLLWLRAPGMSGDQLTGRLRDGAVIVQPGSPLGADDHIRAAIQRPEAGDRLLSALEAALDRPPE
jgi:histidinol-phosphate aminotransferase